MKPFLVSVVVINFNGEKIIKKCIDNILSQSYSPIEIIIIDNCSFDRSREILKFYEGADNIKIINLSKNIGCPGARNIGINYCSGKYIAFIDNDGFADKNWLMFGIEKIQISSKIGAVAPLVLFEKNKNMINGIGGFIDASGRGMDYFYKEIIREGLQYPKYVLYPMGCGMIIKRDILNNIKFDEILFNYYDDTDVGIKIWCLNFKVATQPKSIVYHLQSESDKYNKNKVFLCERNRVYIHLKYIQFSKIFKWFFKEIFFEINWAKKYNINYFYIWLFCIKNLKIILNCRKNFNAHNIFPNLSENKI